jgi:hypothetical protein
MYRRKMTWVEAGVSCIMKSYTECFKKRVLQLYSKRYSVASVTKTFTFKVVQDVE